MPIVPLKGCHHRGHVMVAVTEGQDGRQRLGHQQLVLAQLLRVAQQNIGLAFVAKRPHIEWPQLWDKLAPCEVPLPWFFVPFMRGIIPCLPADVSKI